MRPEQLHRFQAAARRTTPFALVSILGLTVGFAIWANGQHDGSVVPDPTSGDEVLLNGSQVTLQEATEGAGFALLRPDSPLAADNKLTEVWMASGDSRAVALVYDSGIRVYLTAWPAGNPLTPEQFYEQQAAATGAGWTENINGALAWIAPANAQAAGLPPEAIIDFVVGGVEVSLRGGPLSVDELVDVAESVTQREG